MIAKNNLNILTVFLLYLLAAMLITFPLIFHLQDSYHFFITEPDLPQSGEVARTSDTLVDVWFFWLFGKDLPAGRSPATTNLIYGGEKTLISSTINNWLAPGFSLFLQPIFGLMGTFNIMTLLSLCLNGLATYIFCKRFTKNQMAAFVSGLFILGSSYVYQRSQEHLGLSSIYFVISFVHFFLIALEGNRLRNWIFSSVFLFLAGLTSWYFLFYGFIVSLPLIIFQLIKDPKSFGEVLKHYLVHLAVTGVLVATFLGIFVGVNLPKELGTVYVNSGAFSSDLFSFITPNPQSFLWKWFTLPIYDLVGFRLEKQASFLGFLGIAATLYYKLKVQKKDKRLLLLFWSGIIFSLGPFLQILGYNTNIPLPYRLIAPSLPFLQSASRFVIFALIAEAVFLSALMERLLSVSLNKVWILFLSLAVSAFLIIENVHFPYTLAKFNFDNKFYEDLKQKTGPILVLNLPVSWDYSLGNPYYLAQQTFFEQRMVNGYSTFASSPYRKGTIYFSPDLLPLTCGTKKHLPTDYPEVLSKFLKNNKITHILIQKPILSSVFCIGAINNISALKTLGTFGKEVYEDQNITAYELSNW